MKNNTIRYNRMLETIGTLALAILLVSIFVGCASKQANSEANSQRLSTEQRNQEESSQLLSTKRKNPKAKTEPIPQIVKKALDSTVRLVLKDAEGKSLEIGSGFFVRPGLIVTNLHVVEGADSGYAKLVGKKVQYPIENIYRYEGQGLALLKVTAPGVEPLSIESYQYGIPVYVEGNSSELGKMFSKGNITHQSSDNTLISASGVGSTAGSGSKVIRGTNSYQRNIEWFGFTTQISRERSGCPVLNSKGEVIGVSAHREPVSGKAGNFVISSKTLASLLPHYH